jgi:hypothetical protein
MEYKNVTQTDLLLIESMLQKAKQVQHARLSWHVRFYRPLKPRQ